MAIEGNLQDHFSRVRDEKTTWAKAGTVWKLMGHIVMICLEQDLGLLGERVQLLTDKLAEAESERNATLSHLNEEP